MNQLRISNYNFPATLLGGQSFGWEYEDGYFYGFTQTRAIKIKIVPDRFFWQTYPELNDEHFMRQYFRIDVDYERIQNEISKDEHVRSAMKNFPYLRVLRQGFEETLLSFLFTANRNIPLIRTSIRLVARKFGQEVKVGKKTIHLFPKTEVLARASVEDLVGCKTGFRARYIKAAAQRLAETNISESIDRMSESDSRETLKNFPGVGDKIADCVLAFGLGHDNVTPIDVWTKRVLTDFYGMSETEDYDNMRKWFSEYFNGYAAWAGQYLFEYIRTIK